MYSGTEYGYRVHSEYRYYLHLTTNKHGVQVQIIMGSFLFSRFRTNYVLVDAVFFSFFFFLKGQTNNLPTLFFCKGSNENCFDLCVPPVPLYLRLIGEEYLHRR